ncbi:hypothetical protein D3C76_1696130 [compost metagenome]
MLANDRLNAFNNLLHPGLDEHVRISVKRNDQGKLVLDRKFHTKDLCTRSGQAHIAEDFLQEMPFLPGLAARLGVIPG